MSNVDSEEKDDRAARMAARKRYNMKALGQLVDSNRLTGVARPDLDEDGGPRNRVVDEPVADDADGTRTADDEAIEDRADGTDADADVADAAAVDEGSDDGSETLTASDVETPTDSGAPSDLDEGDDVTDAPDTSSHGVSADLLAAFDDDGDDPDGGTAPGGEPSVPSAEPTIELRERSRPKVGRRAASDLDDDDLFDDDLDDGFEDDGVDRSDLGGHVTRTGLAERVGLAPVPPRHDPRESEQPLARHILDEEIMPGGRLSNPRDVPGIVLNLAKDIPAAAAVSVVRIDEEIELVGNTIDPSLEPGVLASMFSGLFRSIQVAADTLADGPLGTVHDLVIEGEHMDLILRPLGVHYYLMVLEDRSSEQANLSGTRMRMAALAPGLAAILAQGDGEV